MWLGWTLGRVSSAIASDGAADSEPSPPPDPAVLGEAARLAEDLERLAAKNAWSGVERTFAALIGLGVPVPFDVWIRGAQAARVRGDAAAVHERLTAANALREEREVMDWLYGLETTYGPVDLRCDPGSWIVLEVAPAEQMPDPDALKATSFARAAIRDTCTFTGLLPTGSYRLYDTPFDVVPRGDVVLVDVRGARMSRAERRTMRRAWLAE